MSELEGNYEEGFYWVTHLSEGDVWYPIYIRDSDFLLDGKSRKLSGLENLVVRKAVMPEDEETLEARVSELERTNELILKHARELIDFELLTEFEDRITPLKPQIYQNRDRHRFTISTRRR